MTAERWPLRRLSIFSNLKPQAMKTILTLIITSLITLGAMAQQYVREPVTYLEDWITEDMGQEEITSDLPAAFYVSVNEPNKLILEKDLEDEGDGVEEIQVEFDDNGNIDMIRFSDEPNSFELIKKDIESLGYQLEEKERGRGYTVYKYEHPNHDLDVDLIWSKVDDMVSCHIVAAEELQN